MPLSRRLLLSCVTDTGVSARHAWPHPSARSSSPHWGLRSESTLTTWREPYASAVLKVSGSVSPADVPFVVTTLSTRGKPNSLPPFLYYPLTPISLPRSIWRWRNQYTDVLSGIGTGIGEGDRGVICGRENECCAAREREQEMDGDAEDAREAETYQQQQTQQSQQPSPASTASSSSLALPPWTPGTISTPNLSATPNPASSGIASGSSSILLDRRTPSPALKPGYERHEIEGIGGVTKKLRLRMVKVGACVPEWDDERVKGEILGREVQGRRRSWCGWCRRVIPSSGDYERGRRVGGVAEEGEGGSNGRENGKGKGREDGGGGEENGEENGGGKGKENEAEGGSD